MRATQLLFLAAASVAVRAQFKKSAPSPSLPSTNSNLPSGEDSRTEPANYKAIPNVLGDSGIDMLHLLEEFTGTPGMSALDADLETWTSSTLEGIKKDDPKATAILSEDSLKALRNLVEKGKYFADDNESSFAWVMNRYLSTAVFEVAKETGVVEPTGEVDGPSSTAVGSGVTAAVTAPVPAGNSTGSGNSTVVNTAKAPEKTGEGEEDDAAKPADAAEESEDSGVDCKGSGFAAVAGAIVAGVVAVFAL